ncbi:hypothetical protein BG844_25625 [Couchioplanes caeruleus subsp. caeruleus]|uniref:Uncharacterized protein n=2 Tax=Couchioplanes caeruleus TaxID=56438 RepID=A0A1K0GH48_9ACTN|nr:hypothetical protein BG844_25625 [Couchioplanes caeruleus subsp. caeruleus]
MEWDARDGHRHWHFTDLPNGTYWIEVPGEPGPDPDRVERPEQHRAARDPAGRHPRRPYAGDPAVHGLD